MVCSYDSRITFLLDLSQQTKDRHSESDLAPTEVSESISESRVGGIEYDMLASILICRNSYAKKNYKKLYKIFMKKKTIESMVFITDGCSFHYAHTWSKSGISICWRHLVTSKESSNPIFFSEKDLVYIIRAQREMSNHLI